MSDDWASFTDDDDASLNSDRKPTLVRTERCKEEMEECMRSKLTHVQYIKDVHDDLRYITSAFQNVLDCMENSKENKDREIERFNGITKESLNLPDDDDTMWKLLEEIKDEKVERKKNNRGAPEGDRKETR